MNYTKLVNNLRKKAYDYNDDKAEQFSRVLLEAKKRKIDSYKDNKRYQEGYAKRQERFLFMTK